MQRNWELHKYKYKDLWLGIVSYLANAVQRQGKLAEFCRMPWGRLTDSGSLVAVLSSPGEFIQ